MLATCTGILAVTSQGSAAVLQFLRLRAPEAAQTCCSEMHCQQQGDCRGAGTSGRSSRTMLPFCLEAAAALAGTLAPAHTIQKGSQHVSQHIRTPAMGFQSARVP